MYFRKEIGVILKVKYDMYDKKTVLIAYLDMIGSTSALNNSVNSSSGNGGTSVSNLIGYNASSLHMSQNSSISSTPVQQFEVIRKWLAKNHKKYYESDPPSNKSLLQFLCQFVQFQEENLGRNASKPLPPITRLPVEALTDFSPNGALCYLFYIVIKYKHENKM